MGKLVIGLTGGIGTGKSAVSDGFAAKGITIADADVAAREVVMPATPALAEISARFGKSILNPDGSLNRAAMRTIVFADAEQRRWLEALTVPHIMASLKTTLATSTSAYALLVLSSGRGQHPLISRNLLVDAPKDIQLSRVMRRDASNQAEVEAIMAVQPSREERLAYADDIIRNDGDLAALHAQVDTLHNHYLTLSGEHHGTTDGSLPDL